MEEKDWDKLTFDQKKQIIMNSRDKKPDKDEEEEKSGDDAAELAKVPQLEQAS